VRIPFTHTGPFTVDLWAKAASVQPLFTSILSTGNPTDYARHFQIEEDGNGNYQVDVGDGDAADPANAPYYAIPLGPMSMTAFQHIAVTYDGTTVRAYLNGSFTGSRPYANLAFEVYKLCSNRDQNYLFNGQVADAHVWDRTLGADEILSITQAGDHGVCF
jgi:hypothetical protein